MAFMILSRFTDPSTLNRALPTKDPQCIPSCTKLHYHASTPVSDGGSTKCITLCPTQDSRTEPTTSNIAVKHPSCSGIQVAKNNCLFSGACFSCPSIHPYCTETHSTPLQTEEISSSFQAELHKIWNFRQTT